MWKEIEEGNIRASGFGLNDRWVPLYNIHKIYAGLRDATLQTDSREAKEMLVKLTDWMIRLVSKLSDEQIQDMLRSEHGGLNENICRCGRYHRRQTLLETGSPIFSSHRVAAFVETGG